MKRLLPIILSLLIIGGISPQALARTKARRPNIIFIQTDDQAAWSLGVSGNRDAHTPNLDRFFREGAYLKNAFVSTPVCSPSRASLMTSRYGTELGITDWINPNAEPNLGLSPDFPTWPKLLADNGYFCGLIGKWHLGTQPQFDPAKFGFKYFMGFRAGGTDPKNPKLDVAGQVKQVEGFVVDVVTDDAIRFVREHRGENFLLMLNYREPHAPYLPTPEEDWTRFQDLDPNIPFADFPDLDLPRAKRLMREYLSSVAAIDRNAGRLLAAVDELKLRQDTVVVFTSDHGYNIGHHGIWHKGNGHYLTRAAAGMRATDPGIQRPNVFDTSLRTPTAIRWPRVIKAGTEIKNTTTNLDWFPTLLSIAGVRLLPNLTIRGHDITPLLKGRPQRQWNDDLYVEWSQHHYVQTHLRMYRTPEWKLVRDFLNAGKDELYHLKTDPDETRNLIADSSSALIKQKLQVKLLAKMRQTNDPALKFVK